MDKKENIENEEPNETTYETMEKAEKREDVYGPFDTIEELMASLNS